MLNIYARQVHKENQRWWEDPKTGLPITINKGELIALMHSELSEMLEGVRRDKLDDHLSQFKSEHVELVDLLIRAFDYAGAYGIDLDTIFRAKRDYNKTREDHTHETRLKVGGKAF